MDSLVLQVEALYQFKGKNNDELCFKKGSIITVTQNDDDTWWEGTLDGNTGWFPANYVHPCKHADTPVSPNAAAAAAAATTAASSPSTEQQHYRAMVLRNLLDSERQHITDLTVLSDNCLKPMANNKLLCVSEYSTLVRNLDNIIAVHKEFLTRLEGEGEKPSSEQRVGGVFLTAAGELLTVAHEQYCSQHPRAVCYIQEHQTEMSRCVENMTPLSLDASSDKTGHKRPGLLVLTTGLSRPFRRLQQYPALLQELYRHLPEAHKDRGDAHRAAKVMADMAASCNALRRQKELELEVITGTIAGWEHGTLGVLGEVQTMGSVAVLPDHTDRYLVVFPKHLVILAVSPRMTNFIFKSQHNLCDIVCSKLDDCDKYKNAFELTGGQMDRLVAVCQSMADQQRWVETLSQQTKASAAQPPLPAKNQASKTQPNKPANQSANIAPRGSSFSQTVSSVQPTPPPHKFQGKPLPGKPTTTGHLARSPTPPPPGHAGGARHSSRRSDAGHKPWSLCDLRPSPPLRPHQLRRARNIKKDERWHEEDSVILRVVEAYCASTAERYNKGALDTVSLAPDRRQEKPGSVPVASEESLLSLMQGIRSDLSRLMQAHQSLRHQFESERNVNVRVRSALDQLLQHGAK